MNDAKINAIVNSVNIRTKPNGSYEARITIDGNRKSFCRKTKALVRQEIREYLHKVENGYREPAKVRLNDYIEYWLKTYKWNKIEPSSYTRLYRVYDCQIRNTIGNKMIGNITNADIQKFIDERTNPTEEGIKPLAISGIKRIIHLLRPCFQMAVVEGLISSNPCDNIYMPVESCVVVKKRQQITLSDSEINRFKEAALACYKSTGEYRNRDALVLLVMLNLGLRVGEMQALKWNDIDMDERIVRIRRTMQNNIKNFSEVGKRNYSREKDATKTYSGSRVIKLNETVLFYLSELKGYDDRNNIQSEYVCSSHAGTIVHERNLQRTLDKVTKRAKIDTHITLHTLRHTFGSTLIRRGVGIEVVSKLMGHANINITYLKYIHVLQEEQAKAMEMVIVC